MNGYTDYGTTHHISLSSKKIQTIDVHKRYDGAQRHYD